MEFNLQIRSGNGYLTDRSWRTRTDSKKVMADQSIHDVVKQPQSVDALRSTDVSGTTNTDSAARAAVDGTALKGSDIKSTTLPPRSESGHTSQQPTENTDPTVSNSQDAAKVDHGGRLPHSTWASLMIAGWRRGR